MVLVLVHAFGYDVLSAHGLSSDELSTDRFKMNAIRTK